MRESMHRRQWLQQALGWAMLPAIILLSSGVGAVIGLSMMLFKGQSSDKKIPFGPYLAGAGLLALLYGHQIMTSFQQYSAP